jgi:hypothetical protein
MLRERMYGGSLIRRDLGVRSGDGSPEAAIVQPF